MRPSAHGSTARTTPLRVVHGIDGFGVGGTELNAIRTLESLDRSRFDLTVVALQETGPLRERYDRAGIPVRSFPMPSLCSRAAALRAAELFRWLRQVRPDVVHCHDLYTNMFVAPLARLAGVRRTITSRRWSDELLPTRMHLVANRLAYGISHVVLANSGILAASLIRDDAIRAGKVVVVENFIDDDGFRLLPPGARASARAALGIPPDAVVAVAVARFRPEKDLVSLVRASCRVAAIRPDFHLLLVGSGPCEAQLRSAAAALAISDRVHFAGLMVGPPSPHQLGEFSVLCSLHEGFPNSIIEAMAVGNAVIATAVGGVPEAVEDNHTGILVPPGAVDSLVRAIARLSSDDCLRRRLGDNGRERVKAHYSSATVLSKLSRLYDA